MSTRQRVVVVTGGGGGIGAAIAESVALTGCFVVTVDPLVSLDGAQQLPSTEQTTADRIVAAGGSARTSGVSVTDAAGVRRLFEQLADEFGGLDAVVNVAGISRPTGFANGSDEDWRSVLSVHLDGYRNVLSAALPLMAAAGRGHILGVTSGSGWRAADAGAYGCAKRAVAALTWQLGRHAAEGVVVNAISPIAATRMVAEALRRTQSAGGSATGGLSLTSMPTPTQLGPLGAHLVSDTFTSCNGRVLFTAGSEVAVIDEPRLIETVGSADVASLPHLLEAATSIALAPAQKGQATGGGSNTRFASRFGDTPADDLPTPVTRSCAIAADRPEWAAAIGVVLSARGLTCHPVASPAALADLADLDAVVLAVGDGPIRDRPTSGWQRILAEHEGIVGQIHSDAQWARAVAELAATRADPIRLVTVTDATTAGGRSRAQASAQLSRAGRSATADMVLPFAISVEAGEIPAELVAHLVCSPIAGDLSGAELVTGAGWFGLRSHPRPVGAITFGGPVVPDWFDTLLAEMTQ
jgi:NAD(P)-dependent dehydrogenase (short-subunit alcohol dehydrogenase family)